LSSCRRNLFAVITVLVIILATYSNTFDASFHFDDESNLVSNKSLHLTTLDWESIKKTFFADVSGNGRMYRPVACFTLALNYYFGKDQVFGYHLVNVSIHILASIFLFLFLYETLNLPFVKAKYGPNSYFISLLATVLWAINPVQTQAVTYIVQRMASMAAMFYIMSMFFYLKGRISEGNGAKMINYTFCLVTAILAFGSKENAAMLPFSILLFDLFFLSGIKRENMKKFSLIALALVFVPLIVAFVLTGPSLFSTGTLLAGYEIRPFTPLERLMTESRVLLLYISLLLYPMPDRLSILHDIPISHSLIDPPTTLPAVLVILLGLAIAVVKAKRWPFISYCVIFYFMNHLVESTILPLEVFFEHRNYLPSMLFFPPLAVLTVRAIHFFSERKRMQFTVCGFVVLVLVLHGHGTFIRNFIWKTEESLWFDAMDKNPDLPRPYHNLGLYYGHLGLREKEKIMYEKALQCEKQPQYTSHHRTYYNLAIVYILKDQEDKALEYLRKSVEIDPRYAEAYSNLGALMLKKGKYDEAYDLLIKALTYNSRIPQAHNNLGFVLLKKGLLDEAITEFKKAADLDSSESIFPQNLGIAYKLKGELQEAVRNLRASLKTNRKNLLARLHLLEIYCLQGKTDAAKRLVTEALEIMPPQKFHSEFMALLQKEAYVESPNRHIISPLLEEAFLERSASLKEMARDFGSNGPQSRASVPSFGCPLAAKEQ